MTSKPPELSIDQLKRHFLECPICSEQYDDKEQHPRVLPCLHSFCFSCLCRLLDQKKYTCPLCNSDFNTGNTTIDLFPKDNTRRDLLDFVQATDKNTFVACDECEENENAVARCKDCFKFLGDKCLKAHKTMKTFRKHKVFALKEVKFDINSISDFRNAEFCSNHDEIFKLYCDGKECQVPICQLCCLTSHMDDTKHFRRNLDEVYNGKKDSLLEKEIKINDMSEELIQISGQVAQTRENLNENSKLVENEINTIFKSALETLESRKHRLLEEVKVIKKEKDIVLQKQEAEINYLREHITAACEFLNKSLASKNQAAFLPLSRTITERFDYLLNTDFNKLPHDSNLVLFKKRNFKEYFQSFVDNLGEIVSTSAYSPNTKVKVPQTVKLGENLDIEVSFYDFTNTQIPEKPIVTCSFLDEKNNAIVECEDKLLNGEEHGNFKTFFKIRDESVLLAKLCIKVNGNDFHCIKLDTRVVKSARKKEGSPNEHTTENPAAGRANKKENKAIDNKTDKTVNETMTDNNKKDTLEGCKKEDRTTQIHEGDPLTASAEQSVTKREKEIQSKKHFKNIYEIAIRGIIESAQFYPMKALNDLVFCLYLFDVSKK